MPGKANIIASIRHLIDAQKQANEAARLHNKILRAMQEEIDGLRNRLDKLEQQSNPWRGARLGADRLSDAELIESHFPGAPAPAEGGPARDVTQWWPGCTDK